MAVRRTILSPPDRRQSRECRRLATLTEQLSELTGPGLRVLGWGRGVGGRVRDPSDAYVVAQNLQAVLCAGVNVLAPRLRASVSKSLVNQLDVTLTHDITCQRCPVERKLISRSRTRQNPVKTGYRDLARAHTIRLVHASRQRTAHSQTRSPCTSHIYRHWKARSTIVRTEDRYLTCPPTTSYTCYRPKRSLFARPAMRQPILDRT